MTKGGFLLLAFMFAACVSFAGAGGPPTKGPLVQGKPLSYWLKELKNSDSLAREEALMVLAGAGEAAAKEAAPILVELLKDKSAPVRINAAIALGQLKGRAKETAPVLLEAWKDGSRTLRHQILPALGPLALEREEILLLLLRASGDADKQTRFLASLTINKTRPAVFAPLAKALDHTDPIVRRQAVMHLGSAGKEIVPSLSRMLKDADWDTRFWAAHALWRIEKNPRAIMGVMLEASAKEDPTTRQAAWMVLLQMKPPAKEALAVYKAALKEGPLPIKVQAAEAVWQITRKADDVLPFYREVLENSTPANYAARAQALAAVKQMGPAAKALRVPFLEMLKQSKDLFLLQSLPPVLARLGPDSIPALVEVAGRVATPSEKVQARAATQTLGMLGKDGLKPLVKLLEHQHTIVRTNVYDALQVLGPDAKEALPALRKSLKHENFGERTRATRVLARLGPDAKEALADLLEVAGKDKTPDVRISALAALPHLQPAIEDIRPLLNDALENPFPVGKPFPPLRLAAADWLWHVDPKDPRPVKIVAGLLKEASCLNHGLKMLVHRRDAASLAIPAVVDLLSHPNPYFRAAAIQALDELAVDSKDLHQKLVAALGDKDASVRMAAALALRKLGVEEKAVVDSLAKSFAAMPEFQRPLNLAALAEFGPAAKDAVPGLERLMPTTHPVARVPWIEALAAIDPAMVDKWKPTLEEAFDKYESMSAARLLGQHDPKETKYVDFLVEKLQDSASLSNRLNTAMTLAKGGAWARQTVPALRQALEDSQPAVRIRAALALERLEPKKHKIVPLLIEALRDREDFNVRIQAANALATLGPTAQDAVPTLRAAVCDPVSIVRVAANEALWKIDPKSAFPCVFQGY